MIPNLNESAADDTPVDHSRRRFLLLTSCLLGGMGAIGALAPFLVSWFPHARTRLAAASVRVDLSHLLPGQMMTIQWRGKPIWILHRTQEMLSRLGLHQAALRDPDSHVNQQPVYARNSYRSIRPEYLVLVGVCTHLGCIPHYQPPHPDFEGDFYCPCHGSRFDLSGRVYKNMPAPINLEVPHYYFVDKYTLVIGDSV